MTILHDSPIFGPIHSRRLGVSLGINLMPSDGKICTFDCIYCECGLNADFKPKNPRPSFEMVIQGLETKLRKMIEEGVLPDVLTFAGNGEPTTHPDFLRIVEETVRLRNQYCPKAKISVLSNSTRIMNPNVHKALFMVDNNILKLDTVNLEYIRLLDRPQGSYDLSLLVEGMKAFNGHCMIQTIFLKGSYQGKDVNNTTQEYVQPWLEAVKEISPSCVMVYTIDRETPVKGLKKATKEELDAIATLVRNSGLDCSVAY